MVKLEVPTNSELLRRIEQLEQDRAFYKLTIEALQHHDATTAQAVDHLSYTINDPREGLIVSLERFRDEVKNDRKVFKAWIAGAAFVISLVYGVVTTFAPAIRTALGVPGQ